VDASESVVSEATVSEAVTELSESAEVAPEALPPMLDQSQADQPAAEEVPVVENEAAAMVAGVDETLLTLDAAAPAQ
jgi:phospholipid-binding lipoprotein MlaA